MTVSDLRNASKAFESLEGTFCDILLDELYSYSQRTISPDLNQKIKNLINELLKHAKVAQEFHHFNRGDQNTPINPNDPRSVMCYTRAIEMTQQFENIKIALKEGQTKNFTGKLPPGAVIALTYQDPTMQDKKICAIVRLMSFGMWGMYGPESTYGIEDLISGKWKVLITYSKLRLANEECRSQPFLNVKIPVLALREGRDIVTYHKMALLRHFYSVLPVNDLAKLTLEYIDLIEDFVRPNLDAWTLGIANVD